MVNTNHTANFEEEIDVIYAVSAFICVLIAASGAGMTTGLLSIDTLKLKIKLEVGTEQEKRQARAILPVLSNHHLLLCTLLIYNAAANEALPIFLDALVPSWAAVVLSITLVLIFGEIIPTALFTGPNQLVIASWFTGTQHSRSRSHGAVSTIALARHALTLANCPPPGLVYLLEIVLYPVAYPMAKVLDYLLGHEEDAEIYTREEISAMLQIIRNNAMSVKFLDEDFNDDDDAEDPLSSNEVNVITGVLGLAKKCIRDVCVPMAKVNMLSSDQVFDHATIEAIDKCGHSRMPVFNGTDTIDIVGFFLVKRLININPEKAVPLGSIPLQPLLVVGASQSLLDVLSVFQMGHSHIALVSEEPENLRASLERKQPPSPSAAAIGVLTIEDIFEAMLQSEIFDEEDRAKGHYQEEASLALREMSLRMSTTPSQSMSLPGRFGYELAAAAAAGPTSKGGYQPPTPPNYSSVGSASSTAETGQMEANFGGMGDGAASGGSGGSSGRGGQIEQTSSFRRILSDGSGRTMRALSEAVDGRKKKHNYEGPASGGFHDKSWFDARASTRSVGSALHNSNGHLSDGSGSAHVPLLRDLNAGRDAGRSVDIGIGLGARGKITPSIVTKYVARRAQQSRDRSEPSRDRSGQSKDRTYSR